KGPLSATLASELGMTVDDGTDVDMNSSAVTPLAALPKPIPAVNVPADEGDLPSLEITSGFGAEPPTGSRSVASAWPGAPPHTPAPPARAGPPPRPAVPATQPPPQAPPSADEAAKWQEMIAGYEREAKALGADRRSAPLWFEIGRVFEERLLQPRQAAT